MEFLISLVEKIFYFLMVISFVAFIHELGHFLVAKLCNVRVDAFAIGMGTQRLWSKVIGETEYSIRIFPIGGFVLLAHEDGFEEDDSRPDPGERSFQRKNIFQKIAILLAGPFMNGLGTIMILTSVFFFFGIHNTTIQVVKLMDKSPAMKAGFQPGDILLEIQGKEIEQFEQGQRIISRNRNKELTVKVERRTEFLEFHEYGSLKNYLEEEYKQGQFIKVFVAKEELPRIFDRKETAEYFLNQMELKDFHAQVSQKIIPMELKVTPNAAGMVGIHIQRFFLDGKLKTYPFWHSFKHATVLTLQLTEQMFYNISHMLINLITKIKPPENIGGPVAIANAVSQRVEMGIYSFLDLAAQICLSIGVFNLIPIPGLDGGRIMLILVRDSVNWFSRTFLGRVRDTFDDVLEGYINIFGVLCVLGLIIIVTLKDIRDVLSW